MLAVLSCTAKYYSRIMGMTRCYLPAWHTLKFAV